MENMKIYEKKNVVYGKEIFFQDIICYKFSLADAKLFCGVGIGLSKKSSTLINILRFFLLK
jgi:hypothetical protein